MSRPKAYDYHRLLGADPTDDPVKFASTIQAFKKTMSYAEIEARTGIPSARLYQWMRKLGVTATRVTNKGRIINNKSVKLPSGDIEIRVEMPPDYLNDILPGAIRDEAERRGMTVDEFLAANERGEV